WLPGCAEPTRFPDRGGLARLRKNGMTSMRRVAGFALLVAMVASPALAEYPDKPIRLIVPQAAGSATDTVARILGAELANELHQQVIVDNRPGGALTIGLDVTA